jgi:hypothetical protein
MAGSAGLGIEDGHAVQPRVEDPADERAPVVGADPGGSVASRP